MTRRQKDPLRPLTSTEQSPLDKLMRAPSASVAQVARAKVLLAVAAGGSYQRAACTAGRRSPMLSPPWSPPSIGTA